MFTDHMKRQSGHYVTMFPAASPVAAPSRLPEKSQIKARQKLANLTGKERDNTTADVASPVAAPSHPPVTGTR
jgi:hypothetical protein